MKILLSLIISALTMLSTPILAEEIAADVISAEKAFARAAIPGMPMSAFFMTLKNRGKKEHFLVQVDSNVANNLELHGHVMQNGMMRMRKMAHIHIKPGQDKVLKPGGLHIMLIGLKEKLNVGNTFEVKLIFDDGSEQTLSVPVKSISATR